MNCSDVKDLLSSYYDGELADERQSRISLHLEQCADCRRELLGFERLSKIAGMLPEPVAPGQLWQRIASELDQGRATVPGFHRSLDATTTRKSRFGTRRWSLLAAGVLLAATVGLFAYQSHFALNEHLEFLAVFGMYLERFQSDPDAAQGFLVGKYESHRVNPEDAVDRVGYRPVVADGLPPRYTIASTHVMKMPCCTCVQCLCRRPDGTSLAIFEHDDNEPDWFDDRPSIKVTCQSKQCSLVELPNSIAASWQLGKRHITVIGARDLEEINDLVAWFDGRTKVPRQ